MCTRGAASSSPSSASTKVRSLRSRLARLQRRQKALTMRALLSFPLHTLAPSGSHHSAVLSAVFHHPADLFGHESLPDTCDVPKLALIIEGMASLLRELAAEPSPSL